MRYSVSNTQIVAGQLGTCMPVCALYHLPLVHAPGRDGNKSVFNSLQNH